MSRKFWFIGSIIFMVIVLTALEYMEDTIDIVEKDNINTVREVSVINKRVGTHEGVIRVFAEIKPRWAVTLKAHVDGEVIEVKDSALAGEYNAKGDVLIRIEDSDYKAHLASAKQALAAANLTLFTEQDRAKRALKDRKKSGIQSESSAIPLQLDIAKKAVSAAKANIKAAEMKKIYTTVVAPFSGIVTHRFVSIGQTVNVGEPLLSILDQTNLDITVSLNNIQWQNLATQWEKRTAQIKSKQGDRVAYAKIKRGGGFLDPKTRQHKLFLEIDNDERNNVLSGDFVNVEIPGRAVDNSLLIPASAYTRESTVWYIDEDNRLRYFPSNILFYQGDNLIITAPISRVAGDFNIVINPLASFIAGKKVNPSFEGATLR
ncbi:efflux RND transporter periplasmic adaptor subunit [Pseudoalteromonas sp. MMG005]|uniref:efflux RND transporter periplasmic adaptor subunit n=1 Tax=Pseudoalteromonas sp. MMG005 TaxID=2822682 RepID=UPI001B39E28D|nr:efflux RND transporter periplasmic adaptor subunit [Pseudoalteromonas sp. MMG005]MBQ4848324.1 efflux RND transporter periplasmic adaptor subunit [Pseudoalteromonas sp. MMG005]